MARKMFRYEMIVDDIPHRFELTGDPLHVAARRNPWGHHAVEFWAEFADDGTPPLGRFFQVFGTGHPLPDGARWVGTSDRTPDGLVWHLYELEP